MATIRPAEVDGIIGYAIEDERFSVVVLPTIGAKIVSVHNRTTNREWIWRNPTRPIVAPTFGSAFDAWDISGYDDCFPTIGECAYPEEPWTGIALADHGEVWTLPWEVRIEGDSINLTVHGVRFPYTLSKQLTLSSDGLRIDYSLTNPTPFPFKFLFSAHPLFAVTRSTVIDIPNLSRIRVDSSMGDRLGVRFDEHAWPLTRDRSGGQIDLSAIDPNAGFGDKLFSFPLETGKARLLDRETGDWVGFEWDPTQLPLLGIWINQGAWPSGAPTINVALEPCNGYPDPLDQAIHRGEHGTVGSNASVHWSIRLNVGVESGDYSEIEKKT